MLKSSHDMDPVLLQRFDYSWHPAVKAPPILASGKRKGEEIKLPSSTSKWEDYKFWEIFIASSCREAAGRALGAACSQKHQYIQAEIKSLKYTLLRVYTV